MEVLCKPEDPGWAGFVLPQVTAHWQKFRATVSPEEEADKVQADFLRAAVRDVRYGPESLIEFTQWRVCHGEGSIVCVGGCWFSWFSVVLEKSLVVKKDWGTVGSWRGLRW